MNFTLPEETDYLALCLAALKDDPGGGSFSGHYFDDASLTLLTGGFMMGDASGDGQVNSVDAAILSTNWHSINADWSMGDFNGDRVVDDYDASIMATNWQAGVSTAASVPEPSRSIMLAGLFLMLLFSVFFQELLNMKQLLLQGMLILPSLILLIGCGDSGLARHNLSGKVTYGGKPVPIGRILFEPDTSKGNDGPQGFAAIENGLYNTDKFGKGAITGPLIVTIVGFERLVNSPDEGPLPKPLFPRYVTRINLSEEAATLDFDIPVSGG